MSLDVGTRLGPYEILASIGAGGMGEVYRARDTRLGRDVAIKVSSEQFTERFDREARAVAALNHPNICHLYDVGPNYLVMELIEGESPKGPMPLEEALRIARQIADALEAAHEKGIVHRDLKPANIKIKPDGTVKVLDFGLAKVGGTPAVRGEDSPTLSMAATQMGMILGTAGYMSPEQARGKEVDKRADIWAFGVVLYELITGRRLFKGEDIGETLAAVIKEEPKWEGIPEKVQPLLRRCLRKIQRSGCATSGIWIFCWRGRWSGKSRRQAGVGFGLALRRRWCLRWWLCRGCISARRRRTRRGCISRSRCRRIAIPDYFALSPDGQKIVMTMPRAGCS